MTLTQYNTLVKKLKDTIFGQKFTVIIVSTSGFCAQARNAGYKKITKIVVSIRKVCYLDVVNKTKGAVKLGVTFNPLRDSYYIDEKLLGLFSYLKSDNAKKYMQFKWDSCDKSNYTKSVYVDDTGQIIGVDINDPIIKALYTPSSYKSLTEGYGRTKVMRENDIHVHHNTPKIENIAYLKIGGEPPVIDSKLQKYLSVI